MIAPEPAVANPCDVEPLVGLGVFEAAGRALVATASDSDELARAEWSSRGSRLVAASTDPGPIAVAVWEALVRVDADDHSHGSLLCGVVRLRGSAAGNLNSGNECTPLSSHAAAGGDRPGTL